MCVVRNTRPLPIIVGMGGPAKSIFIWGDNSGWGDHPKLRGELEPPMKPCDTGNRDLTHDTGRGFKIKWHPS